MAAQPQFHGATVHVGKATGTVINCMLWDTHEDFINFRNSKAEKIREVLGELGPKGRMIDIVAEIPKL